MINIFQYIVVGKRCIYHLFEELSTSGSNSQHKRFSYHKKNTFSGQNKYQVILARVIIYSYGTCIFLEIISDMICELFIILYSIKT